MWHAMPTSRKVAATSPAAAAAKAPPYVDGTWKGVPCIDHKKKYSYCAQPAAQGWCVGGALFTRFLEYFTAIPAHIRKKEPFLSITTHNVFSLQAATTAFADEAYGTEKKKWQIDGRERTRDGGIWLFMGSGDFSYVEPLLGARPDPELASWCAYMHQALVLVTHDVTLITGRPTLRLLPIARKRKAVEEEERIEESIETALDPPPASPVVIRAAPNRKQCFLGTHMADVLKVCDVPIAELPNTPYALNLMTAHTARAGNWDVIWLLAKDTPQDVRQRLQERFGFCGCNPDKECTKSV